ncbi:hypothetical protein IGW68_10820 [Shewanella benthica]|nr:hypothetical protein [Shewanella benthica]
MAETEVEHLANSIGEIHPELLTMTLDYVIGAREHKNDRLKTIFVEVRFIHWL